MLFESATDNNSGRKFDFIETNLTCLLLFCERKTFKATNFSINDVLFIFILMHANKVQREKDVSDFSEFPYIVSLSSCSVTCAYMIVTVSARANIALNQ